MSTVTITTRQLIERLGATDQLALHNHSTQLAAERANLRQRLAALSVQQTEQLYLLGEAAVLLENAVLVAESRDVHIQLSAQLADLYLQFFGITQQQRYLIVVTQILKPLSHMGDTPILWHLVRLYALSQQPALTQHWLKKLLNSGQVTWAQLDKLVELNLMRDSAWLLTLQRQFQA